MFGYPKPVEHFEDFPDGGGYPKGFLEWAFDVMRCDDPSKVLHLCSGSVLTGVRVDIRPERKPDIIADCRNVPLPDESFDFILADPPYSEEYAKNLYGTGDDYPLPGQIVKEAERLLRPDGLLGIMHFQVPFPSKGMKILGVYGISQGCGYAIKAWTLMKKPSPELFPKIRANFKCDYCSEKMHSKCNDENCSCFCNDKSQSKSVESLA